MIEIVEKDLFDTDVQVVMHQCNCFCTMGSGFAKQIKERFPEAYAADCKTPCGASSKLGSYSVAVVGNHPTIRYVMNLYAQYTYGKITCAVPIYTRYEMLGLALFTACEYVVNFGFTKIGIPYLIGCGLAGGNEKVVLEILQRTSDKFPTLTFVLCKKPSA